MILQSESVAKLTPDLIKVTNILTNPKKNVSGYGYNYTDLGTLIDIVKPVLTHNNMTLIQGQGIENNTPVIITTIYHSSGEFIRSYTPIIATPGKKMNDAQAFGSGITYARRYAISSMLFISSEDDTDGLSPVLARFLEALSKTQSLIDVNRFCSDKAMAKLKENLSLDEQEKALYELEKRKRMFSK